ncbi:MAG: isopropylmalate isomerase [Ruegeria sp.]
MRVDLTPAPTLQDRTRLRERFFGAARTVLARL